MTGIWWEKVNGDKGGFKWQEKKHDQAGEEQSGVVQEAAGVSDPGEGEEEGESVDTEQLSGRQEPEEPEKQEEDNGGEVGGETQVLDAAATATRTDQVETQSFMCLLSYAAVVYV
jgi:hypothetical protein